MQNKQGMGAIPGSRASTEPVSRLGPSGFDPERKTFGFIKDDMPDCPDKIGVAIVQEVGGGDPAELIDFRLCNGLAEADAFLASYGLSSSNPVWTKQR